MKWLRKRKPPVTQGAADACLPQGSTTHLGGENLQDPDLNKTLDVSALPRQAIVSEITACAHIPRHPAFCSFAMSWHTYNGQMKSQMEQVESKPGIHLSHHTFLAI